MDIPANSKDYEPIDLDGKAQDYAKLSQLRRAGYVEARYIIKESDHRQQYEDLVSALNFYKADFHVISLQGLHFVLMKREIAELLGEQVSQVREGFSAVLKPRIPEDSKDSEG